MIVDVDDVLAELSAIRFEFLDRVGVEFATDFVFVASARPAFAADVQSDAVLVLVDSLGRVVRVGGSAVCHYEFGVSKSGDRPPHASGDDKPTREK